MLCKCILVILILVYFLVGRKDCPCFLVNYRPKIVFGPKIEQSKVGSLWKRTLCHSSLMAAFIKGLSSPPI